MYTNVCIEQYNVEHRIWQRRGRFFRAGFLAVVGKANSGKSTLLNQMLGEKLSIVTPKA